jgi:prolyl 4-hydroxylase
MENRVYISDIPGIYYIDNFVKEKEINYIINESKDKLKKAHVSFLEKDKGKFKNYTGRTNTSHWLDKNSDPISLNLCKRIAKEIDCDWKHFENYQVIYYGENEEYKYHFDAYDKQNKEKYKKYCGERGNRLKTVLVYLNDVEEGGGTGFKNINGGTEVKPIKGRMVVFENVNKKNIIYKRSLHAGLPIIKGEKWAFNLWLREK